MKVIETSLPGVLLLEPKVFRDDRGFFLESYNKRIFERFGIAAEFVQDNHARSRRNVLRGLHYQIRQPQGKLVRIVVGEVFDVAVDLRRRSPTFGRWVGVKLSADSKRMMWIPEGFAHGYLGLANTSEVLYKSTDYYAPDFQRSIAWNDPDLKISWPLQSEPILSAKDRAAVQLRDAEVYP